MRIVKIEWRAVKNMVRFIRPSPSAVGRYFRQPDDPEMVSPRIETQTPSGPVQ